MISAIIYKPRIRNEQSVPVNGFCVRLLCVLSSKLIGSRKGHKNYMLHMLFRSTKLTDKVDELLRKWRYLHKIQKFPSYN